MNNPSPLVPQGISPQQKNIGRARVRVAVFVVLSIHVFGLMALLMQGCRKPPEPEQAAPTQETNQPPTMDTNAPPAGSESNAPAATVTEAAPAAGAQEYVVAKGDTFTTIAKKFNTTIKAIEDANPGVQPTKLKIGQKLQIPTPTATGTAPSTATPGAIEMNSSGEMYTVKSGDTLTKIASQFGTTIKAIESENNLTDTKIKVGQKLKIPAKSAPAAPAPMPAPAPAPAATNPTA